MIEDFKNFVPFAGDNDPLIIKLVGETYCDKNFNIIRTNSDLTALEFIIDGCGTLDIEGQHLLPEKDDVFFLKVGTKHQYKSDANNPWHKYWIVFDGDFAESLIRCYLPKDVYLFKNCNIKKYFEEIVEISRRDIPYEVMVKQITVCLVHIFMYLHDRFLIENEDLTDIIRKKLDESVESEFNLDKLCQNISYSKNYVINIFRHKFGITPYQYFLDRKIDTAKAYLMHTNISVGVIAKTLHYADQQYFSSCFKRAVGCSPTEFRSRTRNGFNTIPNSYNTNTIGDFTTLKK